jgi:hypothetical protein
MGLARLYRAWLPLLMALSAANTNDALALRPLVRAIPAICSRRTMARLTGYRRLTLRYERNAGRIPGFLTLAATITCYRKLARLTMQGRL